MLLQDNRSVQTSAPKWKIWLFTLALGFMGSISDIRLPEDLSLAIEASIPETVTKRLPDPYLSPGGTERDRSMETPASAFIPPRESELLPFDFIIHAAAGRYNLDPDLIAAVIMTESQFDPRAVSRKGAKGLMQIMPVTAEALELTNVYNPEENINGGSRHLRWLLSQLDGDVRLALAAYNAGLQKVLTYQGVPPYRETEAYVGKVMQCYQAIKDKAVFNLRPSPHAWGGASGLQAH